MSLEALVEMDGESQGTGQPGFPTLLQLPQFQLLFWPWLASAIWLFSIFPACSSPQSGLPGRVGAPKLLLPVLLLWLLLLAELAPGLQQIRVQHLVLVASSSTLPGKQLTVVDGLDGLDL